MSFQPGITPNLKKTFKNMRKITLHLLFTLTVKSKARPISKHLYIGRCVISPYFVCFDVHQGKTIEVFNFQDVMSMAFRIWRQGENINIRCNKISHLSVAMILIIGNEYEYVHIASILHWNNEPQNYNDVIMSTMASQITSLAIVYSTVYSGTNDRTHQRSASLAFVQGIHR